MFGADEGALVDVGVDFDVRVVRELECILYSPEYALNTVKISSWNCTYPLTIINRHSGVL